MSQSKILESTEAGEPKRRGLNARLVVHAIRRRPLAFFGVLIASAAAAAFVWFFLPLPKVTSAVVFQVAMQTPSVMFHQPGDGEASFISYKQSQAALVKRRLTLNSALNQPGVSELTVIRTATPDPLSWLDQKLKVDSKTGSEFMRVTIEGDNGEELRTLLEAVSKAYLADVDERHHGERRRKLAKLEDTRRGYQSELDRFNKRIDAIAYVLGSKDGPTLAALDAIQQNELRDSSRERSMARDELRMAELELSSLDGMNVAKIFETPKAFATIAGTLAATALNPLKPEEFVVNAQIPEALIDEVLRDDPVMRGYEMDLEAARKSLAKTEALFDPGATTPAIIKARDEVKAIEAKRDKYRITRRPELENRASEKYRVAMEARKDIVRQNVGRLRRRDEVAQGKVRDVEERIGKANQYRIELETLKRSIEQTDKLSSQMSDETERLKVELAASPRVTLAEEAFVVPGIEGNRRLKYALMACVGIFLVGFLTLVGWETRNRRITHADDISKVIGIRLLGTVPPQPSGARPDDYGGTALAESVDTARTMLLHGTTSGTQIRSLLVTSAVAREGKTSLSGHFAISLARAGYRVLLVDGDLQAPSAHELYELSPGAGLCELLRGQSSVADCTQSTPIPGLFAMPAGKWDFAAKQALTGDRWKTVRKTLETQFDFLVIDSAPLLLVSDTLMLAREVDGVVLSVLVGESMVSHVSEAANRLKEIGANLAGAVVNGIWHKATKTGYGYRKTEVTQQPDSDVTSRALVPALAGGGE